jgi:hypothetical protein
MIVVDFQNRLPAPAPFFFSPQEPPDARFPDPKIQGGGEADRFPDLLLDPVQSPILAVSAKNVRFDPDPAILPGRRGGAKIVVIDLRPADVLKRGDFPFPAGGSGNHFIPASWGSLSEIDFSLRNADPVGRQMEAQSPQMGEPIPDPFPEVFGQKRKTRKERKRQVRSLERAGLETEANFGFRPPQAGSLRAVQFAFENPVTLRDFEDRPFVPEDSAPDVQAQPGDNPVRQGEFPEAALPVANGQADIPENLPVPPGKILTVDPREKEEGRFPAPGLAQRAVQDQVLVFAVVNRAQPSQIGVPNLAVAERIEPAEGFRFFRERPGSRNPKGSKHKGKRGQGKPQDPRPV